MREDQQLEVKWREVKGALRNLWGQLSEDELEQVRDNIYEISSIVEDRYSESKIEIRNKIEQLLASFDNDTDAGLDPDVSSYQRSPITPKHH